MPGAREVVVKLSAEGFGGWKEANFEPEDGPDERFNMIQPALGCPMVPSIIQKLPKSLTTEWDMATIDPVKGKNSRIYFGHCHGTMATEQTCGPPYW